VMYAVRRSRCFWVKTDWLYLLTPATAAF